MPNAEVVVPIPVSRDTVYDRVNAETSDATIDLTVLVLPVPVVLLVLLVLVVVLATSTKTCPMLK